MKVKEHKFPKKYESWGKDYVLKINYLSSRKEILLHTILGLYLFYFLTYKRDLYFRALRILKIRY